MRSDNRAVRSAIVVILLSLLPACAGGRKPERPGTLTELQPGIYEMGSRSVDRLLELERHPDLEVLVLSEKFTRVSDSHMSELRDWVSQGGVVWVEAPAATEERALKLLIPFEVDDFRFQKSSTGDRGGELVVRGASERLRIHDHPLTEGVNELYVFPRYRFDGTLQAEPLLEMTDTRGNHGIVIAAVPLGKGLVVLDGTAREKRTFFGRMPDFDPDNPNAVRDGGRWNSYDWSRLMENASRYDSSDRAAARR